KLDEVSVSIGGQPAYVYFVSPGQINVVVPNVQPGLVNVTVTNFQGASAAFPATAQAAQPAFFLWNNTYAVATHPDFSYAAGYSSRAIVAGEGGNQGPKLADEEPAWLSAYRPAPQSSDLLATLDTPPFSGKVD